MVRPGAFVVHTTCFINPIHGAPNDYWRFTPHALRLLFADAATWHPPHRAAIRNDPEWPIVTWIVARKP